MFNYRKRYYATHPWELIFEVYREVKWFIQRGRRGYSDCDRWNLCGYLADWIPQAMREFQKYNCGHPGDITNEEWLVILEKIALGFETTTKIDDLEFGDLEEYKKLG